jgi:hypothetical protein
MARKAFSKLQNIWRSSSIHWERTMKIFNACVKTRWAESRFVAEVFKKELQAFVKWCLRYILKIWCPKKVTNTELWQVIGQSHVDLEMRRKSGWLSHDLKKGYDEFPALPWLGTQKAIGKGSDLRKAGTGPQGNNPVNPGTLWEGMKKYSPLAVYFQRPVLLTGIGMPWQSDKEESSLHLWK